MVYSASLPYGARVKLPLVAKVNSPIKEEGKYYPGFKKVIGFFSQYMELATLYKAKAVIAVSKFSHDVLLSEYNADSTVVPDGVDSSFFSPDKDEGKPVVAFPRRRDPRKNLEAIEATELYLAGRVEYCHEPQRADIFFAPSFSEGFDISLLEAMSSGCACLASDIPAHRELIREGVDGWLFTDKEDMKEKLDMLVEEPRLRKMFGKFAREKALGYSWETCAEKTEKVFVGALA